MRKFASLLLCLGLAGTLCISALAAGTAEIVRAFVYEGTLYTYVSMDGLEKPVTKAEAKVGGQTFSAAGRLETVRQAGAPVTWLLLVDNSTSMPAFRTETEGFARALPALSWPPSATPSPWRGRTFPPKSWRSGWGRSPLTSGSPGSTPPLTRRWITLRKCPGSGTSCGAW